ncbi:MAG: acyl-CoA synthetase (NDP forming), partial [Bradymonadia bacterium]
DRAAAQAIVQRVREGGSAWVQGQDALKMLSAYGVPVIESATIPGPDEAIAFAERVGYPVVLKLDDPGIVHKTDVGGVKVNLRSAGEIKGAFWDLKAAGAKRYLVQRMLVGGEETIIGATADPTVGHLLMFGLGGAFVELMKDVAFAVHPLTDADAEEMIRAVKGWPLLAGYRGSAPVDTALLVEVLLRISQLIADFPEIAEMDLNPFIATPEGGAAVDARVRLAPA